MRFANGVLRRNQDRYGSKAVKLRLSKCFPVCTSKQTQGVCEYTLGQYGKRRPAERQDRDHDGHDHHPEQCSVAHGCSPSLIAFAGQHLRVNIDMQVK